MAIDTAAKRRALSGVITGFLLVGVTPDVLKPIEWRQNAGWGYSGIAADAPAAPVVAAYEVVQWRGETNTTESWLGETATAVRFRGETAQTDTFTGEV